MLNKRIVPCMDIREGRIVKGVNFTDINDVGDPVEAAAFYSREGADELVFYDIAASVEGRSLWMDLLERVVAQINIPLMVGGGLRQLEDVDRVMACGAKKVSINSGALQTPSLIDEVAGKYGSAAVTLSMDVKKVGESYHLFSGGGRVDTGRDALEWVQQGEARGAGELVINSIDADGVRGGFDIPLLLAVRKVSSLPIVASGGAGAMEHFLTLFQETDVEAGLAASVFHFQDVRIPALKEYLKGQGIPVSI